MNRFFLTGDAKASLKAIAFYTQQRWGEQQRYAYLRRLDEQFHTLAAFPLKGVARPELGLLLRSYAHAEHIIYYIPETQHIVIVNILHRRMDPHRHLTL